MPRRTKIVATPGPATAVHDGELVIITKGDLAGTAGGTNTIKIVKVGGLHTPEYCKINL